MAGAARTLGGLAACCILFAQAPEPPNLVLRFDVELVQVDAVVTDSRGNHIPGLRAENFEVLQDGRPQKVTHFTYVAGEAPARPANPAGPLVAVQAPTRSEVGRTIVFMLDDSRMDFADFHSAQSAIQHYVDEALQPNDMAAVFRTSYGSGALQMFTSDAKWLHTAVQRMTWRPVIGALRSLGGSPLLQDLMPAIRALAQYPGRKSIVLISPGLGGGDAWTAVRSIADAANRASVTIETIDCRGLPTLQLTAADATPRGMATHPQRETARQMQASSAYFHSQDILAFLAQMTAGRFQHENNDMTAEVRSAADDARGYYLIGWYPGAGAFEAKPNHTVDYHRVQIRLRNAKGLSVRTRDGFFAYPGGNAKVAYSPGQQMNEALFSPFRSGDIDVRLTASLGYDREGGAYIDSLLHILPAGVDFHAVAGRADCKVADLEVLTAAEPMVGNPTGHIEGSHARIQVCKKLDGLLQEGLVVAVRKPIAAPGTYRLLAAVRNWQAGDSPSIGPQALIPRSSMTPGHTPIGSANQLIEVPDPRRQDTVLTGITLESGRYQEPAANDQTFYRLASAEDPAVRQFHPGETLNYSFRLLRGQQKSADPEQVLVRVLHEGSVTHADAPRAVKADEPVTGTYTLDASAEAGHYLLSVSAGPATQWIDFDVKH